MKSTTQRFPLTALATAIGLMFVMNDATAQTIESLQDRLTELRDQANNIQARADAETRPMTEDEEREVGQVFAAFEQTEAEIERRQHIASMNDKVTAPLARKTRPEPLDEPNDDDPQAATRQRTPARHPRAGMPAQPRSGDAGKWGFRSSGEFLAAVLKSSAKGGSIDPRLVANAPTTYGQEGVGADGGFAVPPDFRSTIISKVMGEDSLLSKTDQQTSSSNSITFPADETSPWQSAGGIQAYWEQEGGQKQQSKPALVEKTVKLNKIIALVPLTDELLEDAPAMASYVNKKAPEKIDFKINDAIINGSGVGMPLGILNSPGTIVVPKEAGQAADSVVFENVRRLRAALTPAARKNAVWIMTPDMEDGLMTLSFPGTGTAVPIFMPPGGIRDTPNSTLFGRPIYTTEASPALGDQGDILFGDLSSYLSVVKGGGVRQDVSIHLWFDYDITAFRFVMRVGGQPWWNAPIQPFQAGSSARGFFATLAPRA